jgi:hypothetical protein
MRYRKLLVMLPFLLFFFFSCKKDGANKQTYYMNAEIDGTQTSFPIGILADTISTPQSLSYSIFAKKMISDGVLAFYLLNYNKTKLIPGTYTGTNQLYLYISYQSSGKEYNNIGFQGFTVEITTVTNSSISGNFYGIVKVPLNPVDSVKISNGHFSAPFIL